MNDTRHIQTFTGRRFFPYSPRVEDIRIEDIAHHLAARNRFSGATRVPYSVAEHCIRGATQCTYHNRLWFLLHDADEAYLPDVPTPLKGPREHFASDRLLRAVAERFGLPWPIPPEVHEVDRRMLATERRDLMVPVDWWCDTAEPFEWCIDVPLPPEIVERSYLAAFRIHGGDRCLSV